MCGTNILGLEAIQMPFNCADDESRESQRQATTSQAPTADAGTYV